SQPGMRKDGLIGRSQTGVKPMSTAALVIGGELIKPEDAGYEQARRVHNGMIDKRPALIARCADAADVASAVRFARQEGLLLAVRGGGHNGPGLGTCDGGLVIDLSPMKGARIAPDRRTVRVGAGSTRVRRPDAVGPGPSRGRDALLSRAAGRVRRRPGRLLRLPAGSSRATVPRASPSPVDVRSGLVLNGSSRARGGGLRAYQGL